MVYLHDFYSAFAFLAMQTAVLARAILCGRLCFRHISNVLPRWMKTWSYNLQYQEGKSV